MLAHIRQLPVTIIARLSLSVRSRIARRLTADMSPEQGLEHVPVQELVAESEWRRGGWSRNRGRHRERSRGRSWSRRWSRGRGQNPRRRQQGSRGWGGSRRRPPPSEMSRDWWDRFLPPCWVPSVVERSGCTAVALGSLPQPLCDCIVYVGALAGRVVSVVVGGVVDGVDQQGDGCEFFARADVHIAQQNE